MKDYRITTRFDLNVRQKPDINSKIVTKYIYNTIISVEKIENNWAKTKHGYVLKDYITPVINRGTLYKVISKVGLYIRYEPNVLSAIVGEYEYRDLVNIYEISNGFGRTQKGYISMEYCEKL